MFLDEKSRQELLSGAGDAGERRATRSEMMEEAGRRLDILISMGMPEGLKENFRNGTIYLADSLLANRPEYEELYDPETEMMRLPQEERFTDRIREIGEKFGGVVYLALDSYHLVFGRMVCFFYVAPDRSTWEEDRTDLEEGCSLVYTYNYGLDDGELGEVPFRIGEGGRMYRVMW